MPNELTRRQMIGRAGLALGGVMGVGVLQACGGSSSTPTPSTGTNTGGTSGPTPAQFPYEQHLQAGYQLDVAAVTEAAYQAYYAGGCCHGAYSALLGHLAATAGAPFDQLPIDFGKFGGGGIAGYGSICGALLGSVLIINSVVASDSARSAMLTDLLRWYEGTALPFYTPKTVNAAETGLKLDFSESNLVHLQVVPHSHLCHASVSSWCAANQVPAAGKDKSARCARLTGGVAGKAAEMLNSYLSKNAYVAAPLDDYSQRCVSCHGSTSVGHPVAAGMACAPCHANMTNHP